MLSPGRREVLQSLAGLSLTAILADKAIAQQVAQSLQSVSLTLSNGKEVKAALAKPDKLPAGAVLLIHEWWGLNDQIKSVAAELAKKGYVALAVDLFQGKVAKTPDEAKAQIAGVNKDEAVETLAGWIDWLRASPDVHGKIATMGWCFGGGWSLVASLTRPVEGTIIYYGKVDLPAEQLSALKGPVLGHFGKLDKSINTAMVAGFRQELKKAGKSADIYEYDADHAFANPSGERYDQADAQEAWQRSLAFLKKTIG